MKSYGDVLLAPNPQTKDNKKLVFKKTQVRVMT